MARPEDRFKAAQAIAEDPELRDCLLLVSKGIPFDVAFALDEMTRMAWCIILGELDGARWSWERMAWESRD